ncbi:MAG: hypothetical protein U0U70_00990 [Chitinophagaceae bacterium]
MKKAFAFILLLCITAQTFSQVLIRVDFYLNRRYIARNLCENRYRPMLHCNGKCVLAKKWKQEQKKDEQAPERKMQGREEISSCDDFITVSVPSLSAAASVYSSLSDNTVVDQPASFFHPPGR